MLDEKINPFWLIMGLCGILFHGQRWIKFHFCNRFLVSGFSAMGGIKVSELPPRSPDT
jgi:hypothetical protein